MKKALNLFFALAAGAASAFGQTPPGVMDLSHGKLHMTPPTHLTINSFLTDDTARAFAVTVVGPINSLMPDYMPCLVPDLARVERMPVNRSLNADPMPNKSHPGPRLFAKPGDPMPNGMDGMKK
jgi:hypothetical protein